MRTFFLLAMPFALVALLAGCDEAYQSSASSRPSGQQASVSAAKSTTPAAAPAAPAPAPAPAPRRNTTTQPLPNGWGYVHEQDLTGGALKPEASGRASMTTTTTTGVSG